MTVRFGRSSKAVKEVAQLEIAPFIQIRKKGPGAVVNDQESCWTTGTAGHG